MIDKKGFKASSLSPFRSSDSTCNSTTQISIPLLTSHIKWHLVTPTLALVCCFVLSLFLQSCWQNPFLFHTSPHFAPYEENSTHNLALLEKEWGEATLPLSLKLVLPSRSNWNLHTWGERACNGLDAWRLWWCQTEMASVWTQALCRQG